MSLVVLHDYTGILQSRMEWLNAAMQKVEVQSQAISAVQYSRENKTLTVWYQNGGVYEYSGVTEYLYRRLLLNQPHPWHYLGKLVKEHPFKRLK